MPRRAPVWAFALLAACGPLGPLPGGELDGELSPAPPGDWSFSDAYNTIQLEVRPRDRYSVNLWCVATGGHLYVGAGQGASSVWAAALLEDGRARVRIGTLLYEVVATRVTSVDEIQAYLAALARKHGSGADVSDFQPGADEPAAAVLFRLDSSD